MKSLYKPVSFNPLTGIFDARANVEDIVRGAFRWKQNMAVNADGKLARAKGWKRAFDYPCLTNHDFHEQHVASNDLREPLTLLFPSTAEDGKRRLFGATKTRILRLDEPAGDWVTIGVGYGDDGSDNLTQLRFSAAELKDQVFFTNGLEDDGILYLDLGTDTLAAIPGLATAGDPGDTPLTAAKRVISWNGVIMLLATTEGGVFYPSRVRWSNLNDGLDWSKVAPSISDFQDLDYGHVILNAVPIGTSLYIFTDRSIWRCNLLIEGTEAAPIVSLQATRVYYEPRNKAKCLAYPNTLISDGRSAYYLASDNAYIYTPGYTPEPETPEWLHHSTSIMFSPGPLKRLAVPAQPETQESFLIDARSCQSPITEYNVKLNELHFTWPTYDIPAVITIDPNCADFVPSQPLAGSGYNRHTLVVNLKYKTCDYRDYGSTAMANFTTDFAGIGQCNQEPALFAVNSVDWSLKQLEIGDGREMFNPATGLYTLAGYYSILRFVFPFEKYLEEKQIRSFAADLLADDPADLAVARLRVGTADRALDPNRDSGSCGVLWHRLSDRPIKCSYTKTPAQYVAALIRPNPPVMGWNFLYRGRFLYVELTLSAADGTAPTTGGCVISRLETEARII